MNKQDILNAFREEFSADETDPSYFGWALETSCLDVEQWLLTALTEFERETKERIKLCAKEQSCSMCMESLSQLEKEKRT